MRRGLVEPLLGELNSGVEASPGAVFARHAGHQPVAPARERLRRAVFLEVTSVDRLERILDGDQPERLPTWVDCIVHRLDGRIPVEPSKEGAVEGHERLRRVRGTLPWRAESSRAGQRADRSSATAACRGSGSPATTDRWTSQLLLPRRRVAPMAQFSDITRLTTPPENC